MATVTDIGTLNVRTPEVCGRRPRTSSMGAQSGGSWSGTPEGSARKRLPPCGGGQAASLVSETNVVEG